jgi:hypothetical protein
MFAWKPTPIPQKARERMAEARLAMYRKEIEDRAALLYRLGYPQKQAKERLKGNVAWDFELHGRPKHAAEVDKIVETVYRRGSASAGTPSV